MESAIFPKDSKSFSYNSSSHWFHRVSCYYNSTNAQISLPRIIPQRFYGLIIEILCKFCLLEVWFEIRWPFGTCHGSSAAKTCAKLSLDVSLFFFTYWLQAFFYNIWIRGLVRTSINHWVEFTATGTVHNILTTIFLQTIDMRSVEINNLNKCREMVLCQYINTKKYINLMNNDDIFKLLIIKK